MYKLQLDTPNKSVHNKLKAILLLVVGVLVVSYIILSCVNDYQKPTLVGKWTSTETGTVVKFTKDEEVIISTSPLTGTYHIISPNTMEYTIDNLTFTMYYSIEDEYLYWGVSEEALECFKRK